MDPSFRRLVDHLAAEPVRVSAILRLPLIGLIAVLVWIWEVDHWLPELYAAILGAYAVAAVLWLIAVLRGPVPRWADWASTIVDLLVIVALCLVSGVRRRLCCRCSSCCRSRWRSGTGPG